MQRSDAGYSFTSVHELFEQQVERAPDRIALVYQDRHFTYQALNLRSHQLACHLQQNGVGPETIVGIYVGNPANAVIGILGVLKAGGAYTPLNVHDPQNRTYTHLRNAQVQHVILDSHSSANFEQDEIYTIDLDNENWQTSPESHKDLSVGLHGKNLAYVIHTSGTTGEPKGVAMSHEAFANLITWHTEALGGDNRNTMLFTSLSFDASNQELFTTICVGGSLYLIDETIRHDMFHLISFIQQYRIGRILLFFAPLQNFLTLANDQKLIFDDLRDIITAGEPIKITPQVLSFFQRNNACRFFNMYGLTETHTVTCFSFPSNPDSWSTQASIGAPIRQTTIHLMSEQQEHVGAEERGEIYVSGMSLARGYLNRPELTAEKYLPFPFSNESGERMCRTGDLGRTLPDGSLECLGRRDHQVKIRGYRVELSEVEAVITQHASVQEAVVIARTENIANHFHSQALDDDPGGSNSLASHLVAYLVVSPHHEVTTTNIRTYLNERLPQYMMPSFFVFMEKLPLSNNGKVDRNVLPSPLTGETSHEQHLGAPRNPIEEVVIGLWAHVLNHEDIDIHTNFFEWGGDSLAATRLISEVRKLFQCELGVRSLFEHPTVEEFAQELVRRSRGDQNIYDTAKLILMVANLSEEEVDERLLQQG